MKRNIALIIVGLAAIAGFIFVLSTGKGNNRTANSTNSGATSSPNTSQKYTATDVAKHTTASDCWTIIDGNVYNLTSFIPQHPGGTQILQACGVDATNFFHGMDAQGQNHTHDSRAQDILNSMQIGVLSN